MNTNKSEISAREQGAILTSLAAGLVPQLGLQHLVVGRKGEIQALAGDLDAIQSGGATFRVIIGPNGAGKTFLEHLDRDLAIQAGLVVLSADLTPHHRLHATDGRTRALYSSLMANVYTKACPSGNGLRPLLESWISGLAFEDGVQGASPEGMTRAISERLRPLKDYLGGFEFAQVLGRYYEGYANDNPALQDSAVRWLRAEYSTKTEARHDLGVRRIINDEELFAALKLFSAFCCLAGHRGVLVMLDELTALTHRLPDARARRANVQVLLNVINDCIQGDVSHLGFLLAGTPDALNDPERGLFSVPALQSRFQSCAPRGCVDYSSPVLTLEPLGKEDLLVLMHNVRRVHALGDTAKYRLPDEALEQFLMRVLARFGQKAVANPRDVLRPFVSILNILDQEPDRPWQDLITGALTDKPTSTTPAEATLANLNLR